jgi:ABC-type Fe3+-siderophore transport system permease subunit
VSTQHPVNAPAPARRGVPASAAGPHTAGRGGSAALPGGGVARSRAARRRVLWAIGLVVAVIIAAIGSVFVGAQALAPADVVDALLGRGGEAALFVHELRVPRALLGVVVGLALGAAGALMQALTRNPLAEPGLLGVNAGAAAAVVTGLAFGGALGLRATGIAGSYVTMALAFVGAAAASALVLLVGGATSKGTDPVRLTLAGAALTVVLGAYTNAMTLNQPQLFEDFVHWSVGSLQGRGYESLWPVASVVLPALVVACLSGRWLNALALGPEMGRALGADPRRLAVAGGALVVALAGAATAGAGPIAFVGLAAPLVVRGLVGPDYRWVVPLSACVAAVVVLVADVIGRVVMPPSEVETAVVAALLGAPVFIAVVRRRRMARL